MIISYTKNGVKYCRSPGYNYAFDSLTGNFARWGETSEDDPKVGHLEIFDLEVSTVCRGIGKGPCKHCYKSNTARGENMSFDVFKKIFDKLPKTLTQIAFGVGDLEANPDLRRMFDYCRDNWHNPDVVPNLTINGYGLTKEWAEYLAETCGGVAVSVYDPKDVCYDAVERLISAGMTQTTIHQLVSVETYNRCFEVIDDAANDLRLKGLKAVMFLTLKPKGKRNTNTIVKDVSKYRALIDYAFKHHVNIGFDSCSAPIFLAAMKGHPLFESFSRLSESCESNRFSGYANVKGEYWHCSFTEDQPGWKSINLIEIKDFDRDVWNSTEVGKFRNRLLCQENGHIAKECYLCPVYNLYDPAIGNASKPNLTKQERQGFNDWKNPD